MDSMWFGLGERYGFRRRCRMCGATGKSAALSATPQAESSSLARLYAWPGDLAIRCGNWNSVPFTETRQKRESSASKFLAEDLPISEGTWIAPTVLDDRLRTGVGAVNC